MAVALEKTIGKWGRDEGIILNCSEGYRCGYPGGYNDQFYAPFILEFPNRSAWIVFSTNSIRTDRMSIQQWNAENIKKINKSIIKAIVVVPDEVQNNEKERHEVEKYNEKIQSGKFYSVLDHIYYQSQFAEIVQNNCID